MQTSIKKILLVCSLLSISSQAPAALVTLEGERWFVTYDSDTIGSLGTPSISGNTLNFSPFIEVSAPADQQYYSDAYYFDLSLTFVAKPGHSINGYSMNASGTTYVGDDARLGVSGAFNREFYGASYYSGALTGDGTWSDSTGNGSPNFGSLSGALYVETTNHYSYEQQVGYNEIPVYIGDYMDVLVGYEPIYDDEGNEVGSTPIYESQYYERIDYYIQEPIYETFYQTSGGSINMNQLSIEVSTSAVPLPSPALLLLGGMGCAVFAARRGRIRSA